MRQLYNHFAGNNPVPPRDYSLVAAFNVLENWMAIADAEDQTRSLFDAAAMPHMAEIFRMSSRMLRERSRAEDVTQEVFLQAWKSFHRFTPGTNCRAWLYRILFHCVDHQRRKWFRFPLLMEPDELADVSAVNSPYREPLSERITDEDILGALDKVPADFRAVVLLVDVEEFAYKEAAQILGVPIGTVMSRLSRGRKLLKEQLADVARTYGIGE